MVSRREWIGMTVGAGAARSLNPRWRHAVQQAQIIQRAIPSTGERVPVIGLGSSATFSRVASGEDKTALKEVLKTMVDLGGKVFDTAPSYGASEQVAGEIAKELGITNKIFWATKVNVARGGAADPAAAKAQIEDSFRYFGVQKMDAIQVHNLGDVPTQLGILKEMKQQGRVRYIGVTTTSNNQYTALEQIMRNEPIDLIGLDYAIDNREVEQTILPLAIERKIGVLVYLPLGRNRLLQRAGTTPLPDFAKDLGITTWAQFFIKYIVANPAVTSVTAATSQAKHMAENIQAGVGKLPDAATLQKMRELVDAMPAAPGRGRGAGAGY